MDARELRYLLEVQDGVISRRQLLELGAAQHDVDRMLRRADLPRVQAGVYVNHTGPLTWVQRAWSAVLYYWPAALTQLSALPETTRGGPHPRGSRRTTKRGLHSWGTGAPEVGLRVEGGLVKGACSVLEHGYLVRVERRHGLPRGDRQVRGSAAGRRAWRDVTYAACRTIVELDGRPFHDTARLRDKDFDRDLDAAVDQTSLTVRLTYGQVFGTPCRTAARIGQLLQARGWSGSTRLCPECR
jgi:hypothetical protein